MGESKATTIPVEEFDWVKLTNEVRSGGGNYEVESQKEKLIRKLKENPAIPVGCLITTGFLARGIVSLFRKESAKSQKMMRGRVIAQGVTVFTLLVGVSIGELGRRKKLKTEQTPQ